MKASTTLLLCMLLFTSPAWADTTNKNSATKVQAIAQVDRDRSNIPNELIDRDKFLKDLVEAHNARAHNRRITEEKFLQMAKEPATIILDARSANRFAQMHIAGAKSLPFTEFTADTLKKIIPSKDTRILIYCNNNVKNSPVAFATKSVSASLNLSTFPALYSYGYKNVYELGPAIDPKTSKIKFEGSLLQDVHGPLTLQLPLNR